MRPERETVQTTTKQKYKPKKSRGKVTGREPGRQAGRQQGDQQTNKQRQEEDILKGRRDTNEGQRQEVKLRMHTREITGNNKKTHKEGQRQ